MTAVCWKNGLANRRKLEDQRSLVEREKDAARRRRKKGHSHLSSVVTLWPGESGVIRGRAEGAAQTI